MSFSFLDVGVRKRNHPLGVQVGGEHWAGDGTANQLFWPKEKGKGHKMKRVTRRFPV